MSVVHVVPFILPQAVGRRAYAVDVLTSDKISDDRPVPVWSSALLRAVLIDVLRTRPGIPSGALALHEPTGAVTYTYGGLPSVFHALPAPDHGEAACAACGQWDNEHKDASNATHCGRFRLHPVPGTRENLYCSQCVLPQLHHGRPFTTACDDFRPMDLRGRPITPYLAARYVLLRDDKWVLANVQLPADDEKKALEVMNQAKAATIHWAHRATYLCIPAGQYRGTDWQGDAAEYGTAHRP